MSFQQNRALFLELRQVDCFGYPQNSQHVPDRTGAAAETRKVDTAISALADAKPRHCHTTKRNPPDALDGNGSSNFRTATLST